MLWNDFRGLCGQLATNKYNSIQCYCCIFKFCICQFIPTNMLVLSLLQSLLSVLHLTMLLYTVFTQIIGSKIQEIFQTFFPKQQLFLFPDWRLSNR